MTQEIHITIPVYLTPEGLIDESRTPVENSTHTVQAGEITEE